MPNSSFSNPLEAKLLLSSPLADKAVLLLGIQSCPNIWDQGNLMEAAQVLISGIAGFPAADAGAGMCLFIPLHEQPVHLQVLTGI